MQNQSMAKIVKKEPLLSRQDVTARLNVSKRTIQRWELRGKLTPIKLDDQIVRYSALEVEALITNSTVVRTLPHAA